MCESFINKNNAYLRNFCVYSQKFRVCPKETTVAKPTTRTRPLLNSLLWDAGRPLPTNLQTETYNYKTTMVKQTVLRGVGWSARERKQNIKIWWQMKSLQQKMEYLSTLSLSLSLWYFPPVNISTILTRHAHIKHISLFLQIPTSVSLRSPSIKPARRLTLCWLDVRQRTWKHEFLLPGHWLIPQE